MCRIEDAIKLLETTLSRMNVKLSPNHPHTLICMQNLANVYDILERHAETLKLRTETLALMNSKFGPNHSSTLLSAYNLAISYRAAGRFSEALKLHEDTLKRSRATLRPKHPKTILYMAGVAVDLVRLERSEEAISIIDECFRLASGEVVHPRLHTVLMFLRIRHFQKIKDAAGCLASAEMWDNLERSDSDSLYDAACWRAVTATVVKLDSKTPKKDAIRLAKEQADQAMAWLNQAIVAGYKNFEHAKKDEDLSPLRGREDFKKLMAKLRKKQPSKPR